MTAGIWTCGECGEDVDIDEIDFDTPDVCCPVCNTPVDDGEPDYEIDDTPALIDDRYVTAVNPMGGSIR